jgi:gas vesicle protein
MKKKEMLLLGVGIGAAITAAAAIFLWWKKDNGNEEKPPKNAPQVPIDNPGDQSEFTTSASESEIG